ncbi:MAG: ferredoxin--NADP reductase [Frankiaceae bacterium]|nr:ferredoxin--NADP reductase [Frankiaceae bacterium]
MAVSSSPVSIPGAGHDRGYHPLTIAAVVNETADAATYILDVPLDRRASFMYRAGQFLTFRLTIDGTTIYRSYSMSSAPEVDDALAVTVKRVPAGRGSNWMLDNLAAGDTVEASVPAGVFTLGTTDRPLMGFAAGSGITPVISLLKAALATTARSAALLYANRDGDSVIFAAVLADLVRANPERLTVDHRYDCDDGFVDAATIAAYVETARAADCYICGPGPFMDIVETALLGAGVPAEQIHIERFTVTEPADPVAASEPAPEVAAAAATGTAVTIELDGQTKSTKHHPGTTILQTARQMGMSPPFSCEAGNCATCMAKLLDGEVTMYVNDALYDDEVADGWILTCQSVPTTPTVHVVYGYEET